MANDEWFEQLYRDHYRKVVAYFVGNRCSREDARDFAQETFARVYKAMDRFLGQSSAKSWLFIIARNLLLNEWRYRKSRGGWHGPRSLSELTEREGERAAWEPAAGDPAALDDLIEDENVRRLWDAIAELPQQQRICVHWRLLHELKYREIAKLTGKSMETVKSLLHEAKETLRLRLSAVPELDEPDEGESEP